MDFLKNSRGKIEAAYSRRKSQFPHFFQDVDQAIESCGSISEDGESVTAHSGVEEAGNAASGESVALISADTLASQKRHSAAVGLALRYLYGTMPLSDMANYSWETFWDFARHGVALWEEEARVRKLPEELYLNYVLHHRVNEEEIRPCRNLFRMELKDRVAGKSPSDIILEVNYWCAEHVTYRCGDERTLSARAVYERGYGRCGEESVFTVNALRSVGIPARQVYVPRWSHCDDNHAWVEAWLEDKWIFLGACEPQQVFNRGWFTEAASRAMMVHARVFDTSAAISDEEKIGREGIATMPGEEKIGQEEIVTMPGEEKIGREGIATMLNELERYAKVQEIVVRVVDEKGQPLPGACVRFEILNSAEYYPVAVVSTDSRGIARLKTGYGSLHLWVSHQGKRGSLLVDTREADTFTLAVTQLENREEEGWVAMDFFAPVDTPVHTAVPTPRQKALGRERMKEADRLRKERTSGWVNPALGQFLAGGRDVQETALRRAMLETLTEKDRTDICTEVLEDYFQFAAPKSEAVPEEIYIPYVLAPRVEHEILMACRRKIRAFFSGEQAAGFVEDPRRIWDWISEEIFSYPELERSSVITVPAACLRGRTGSQRSKWIFFVAIARVFGIPARLNPEDHAMEYWKEGRFHPVFAAEEKTARIVFHSDGSISWNYFQNWSLAKLGKDGYESLRNLKPDWQGNQEIHAAIPVSPGQYRIVTTNRLPNGNQLIYQKEISIAAGETKEEILRLRETVLDEMLEKIVVPEFSLRDRNGKEQNGSSLTKDGECIFFWLEERREPTEHILNEILEQKTEYAKVQQSLCFIVRSKEALEDPAIARVLRELPEIQVYYDPFEETVELLARRMYVDPELLPLILVFAGERTGIYACSGYQVWTGNLLLRILNHSDR